MTLMHSRAVTAALLLYAAPLAAQSAPLALPFVPGVDAYSADIPRPEAVLGYVIGTRHTRPDQLVEYFRAVAAASDRVVLASHGTTWEGRPLVHAVVTSAGNQARLDQIRQANLRLSDDPAAVTDAELAAMPAVVYLGYSIHGDEASGSEAAMLTLYHLAAGRGPAVDRLLDSLVILVDPSFNPDGRARFVDWVNGNRGAKPTTDSQDREHNQPWPGGRTNHYWFDLNRDWLPATQPESQGRLALFHTWRPQFLADFHEMGGEATFFFQPGIPSRNNPNTPAETIALTERLAAYHARALDRIGSLYYSRESFDDFYYGKGSTYPDINGAVGILFEQASSRALAAATPFGDLRYAFTVRNHLAASLSSLEGVAAMRRDFLAHQRDFYRTAPAVAARLPVKAWLVSLAPDRTRTQLFLQLLQRHRIRVHRLARAVTIDGETFRPDEALVVPAAQPQVRLLKAMMERVTTFQDSLFYDVSTWTLPLAFGLTTAEVRTGPGDLLGPVLAPVDLDGGAVIGGEAPYAYVMEWDRHDAPRALARILAAGIRPVVATRPFELATAGGSTRFAAGSIIVPIVQRDAAAAVTPAAVHALVRRLADEDHVVFHAAATGQALSGPDLGTRSAQPLVLPRVAILSGAGSRSNLVGEAWHLLDARVGLATTLLDVDRLDRADLARYTTLVVTAGLGQDSARVSKLRSWVKDGGVLIGLAGGARWAIERKLVDEKLRPAPTDTLRVPYADVAAAQGAQQIGGSIFQVRLDPTHPVAFGYGERAALFVGDTLMLEPSVAPGANVARYTDAPLLSGYVSPANLKRLAGSAAVVARRLGRGSVVLFAEDPNFRAFWYGSDRLFVNAVFFGGVL